MSQRINELESELANAQSEMSDNLEKCVSSAVDGSILNILLLYKEPIKESINSLSSSYKTFYTNPKAAHQLVKSIEVLGTRLASFLLYGKACSHASPNIDIAENLVTSLEEFAKHSTDILERVRRRLFEDSDADTSIALFQRCCDLVISCEDLSPTQEDMAGIIEREMSDMDNAIREAVDKFSRLLEESRAKDTGIQLEVNEGILATCSELMTAVRILVQRASELQSEIVAAGKGGASPREFYKRNHRWTEGLISGAKTVAIACRALVKAADAVVTGKGKFEEVIVSSKEIAASSMQLVMASRVKAERESGRMRNLNMAAKTISTLTGTVVATAETTLDFSKLTLHSAKRLEMETLVKVLETEKKLETERAKLSELRRHHYQLAGELEGWEEKHIGTICVFI
ncbi:Huntington interacting protein related 1 [Armadillidium nasatum]|uniref:Huntington interacting protein related 1 n=1 Tax=Armadillidium nasatum TaxID=96803 RepID=A0A5N5TBD0_9CRUS|nr:Huntington interacting protein related 1 [Armadillidium nasatum]